MPDVLPPADWFPDPTGRHQQRYWDGSAWTEHVFTDGTQAVDPLEAAAATSDEVDSSSGTTATEEQADADPAPTDLDSSAEQAAAEDGPAVAVETEGVPATGTEDASAVTDDRAGWFLLSTDTTPPESSTPASAADASADQAEDTPGTAVGEPQALVGDAVDHAEDAVGDAADGTADAGSASGELDAVAAEVEDARGTAAVPTEDAESDGTDTVDAAASVTDATTEIAAQALEDGTDAGDAAGEPTATEPTAEDATDAEPTAEDATDAEPTAEDARDAESGGVAAGVATGVAGGAAAGVAAYTAGTAGADASPADTPAWAASPPPTVPVRPIAGTGGITGALVDGAYGEQDSDEPAALQNSRLLRCHLTNSTVLARQGTMVAYQGKVDFAYEGAGGFGRAVKRAATGEGVRMMRVSGAGDVFFADEGKHVFLLHLDGQSALSVNGRSILAFSDTLQWSIERVQGATLLSGGLFNTTLKGTGWVALVSDGEPVVLRTEEAPTFADVNALVAWSADLQTKVVSSVKVSALAGFGSGEAVQMQFTGTGIVVIQPSEGRPVATQ